MNTQEEKENQLAVRRQTLLASQQVIRKCNVLSKEIDGMIKMLNPIGLDDFPFKVRPPVMFEPSEIEVA